jgi:hypothetical protein
MNMKSSIRKELGVYINECLEDGLKSHNEMFNEGLYLHGNQQCLDWLNHHNLDVLSAISICREYQMEQFGQLDYDLFESYEVIVNQLSYWYGLELCNESEVEID